MNDPGGSAFPTPDIYHPDGQVQYGELGMTLRDYFAAKALQGMITTAASPALLGMNGAEPLIAQAAYKLADAMIAERNKNE